MSKEKFIKDLAAGLKGLSKEETEEALQYYIEYFEDSPEPEEEIIQTLGNPKNIARQINAQSKVNEAEILEPSAKKSVSALVAVILAIFAIPIGVPILFALAVVVLALLISIFAVILSFFIAGAASALAGIVAFIFSFFVLFIHPATGIFALGTAIAAIGIGVIIIFLTYYVNKFLVGGLISLAKHIMRRNKDEKQ